MDTDTPITERHRINRPRNGNDSDSNAAQSSKIPESSHRVDGGRRRPSLAMSPFPQPISASTPSGEFSSKSETTGQSFSKSQIDGYWWPGKAPNSTSQVDRLRLWRHDAYMQHQFATAEYIGNKIVSLTGDPIDVFWLAQTYYETGQYARGKQLLMRGDLCHNLSCRYLAALCLARLGKLDEALSLIGSENISGKTEEPSYSSGIKLESSLAFLRGQIYAVQNNTEKAKECYVEAVKLDVKCFEAFNELISNTLLTTAEEWDLIEAMDFTSSLGEDSEMVRMLYSTLLSKYLHLDRFVEYEARLRKDYGLQDNNDISASRVDALFMQCRFTDCCQLCERILKNDQFFFSIMPTYLSCLWELRQKNKLFLLAHNLVDYNPEEPVAWLAVGIYYLSVGKLAEARRFFSKSSMMNPHFGPAWIGFAHTFASEGEHEQAIAAYSTAARLFQGMHFPYLFLGTQHLQLNNLSLAGEYLQRAYDMCHTDPFVLNETGVMHFMKGNYEQAQSIMSRALEVALSIRSEESALISIELNLGHVYRRQSNFDTARDMFENVLRLSPGNAQAYASLGLVQLQMGDVKSSISSLHRALGLAPNDPLFEDLLSRALRKNSILLSNLPDTVVKNGDRTRRNILKDSIIMDDDDDRELSLPPLANESFMQIESDNEDNDS